MDDIRALEEPLGHTFRNPTLARRLLIHQTALNEQLLGSDQPSNEALAVVGDAVVALVVRQHFYYQLEAKEKGQLTEAATPYLSNPHLARRARELGLTKQLIAGKGLKPNEKTPAAQLLEAAIGAIHLDIGYEEAYPIIQRLILPPAPASPSPS